MCNKDVAVDDGDDDVVDFVSLGEREREVSMESNGAKQQCIPRRRVFFGELLDIESYRRFSFFAHTFAPIWKYAQIVWEMNVRRAKIKRKRKEIMNKQTHKHARTPEAVSNVLHYGTWDARVAFWALMSSLLHAKYARFLFVEFDAAVSLHAVRLNSVRANPKSILRVNEQI